MIRKPTGDLIDNIRRLLRSGQKIEAVKAYRLFTGCDLNEAKEAVETIEGELSSYQTPAEFRSHLKTPTFYANISVGFLAFGLFLSIWMGWRIYTGFGSEKWPTTEGIVIESRVVDLPNDPATPHVLYEYVVGGQTYRSDRIAVATISSDSIAPRIVRRYRAGSAVTVYYNPDKPSRSLLEPGISLVAQILFSAGLLLLGLYAWARGKYREVVEQKHPS